MLNYILVHMAFAFLISGKLTIYFVIISCMNISVQIYFFLLCLCSLVKWLHLVGLYLYGIACFVDMLHLYLVSSSTMYFEIAINCLEQELEHLLCDGEKYSLIFLYTMPRCWLIEKDFMKVKKCLLELGCLGPMGKLGS